MLTRVGAHRALQRRERVTHRRVRALLQRLRLRAYIPPSAWFSPTLPRCSAKTIVVWLLASWYGVPSKRGTRSCSFTSDSIRTLGQLDVVDRRPGGHDLPHVVRPAGVVGVGEVLREPGRDDPPWLCPTKLTVSPGSMP